MDNNQNQQSQQVQPVQPSVAQTTPVAPKPEANKDNKLPLLLATLFVILIVAAGAIFLAMNKKTSPQSSLTAPKQTFATPTPLSKQTPEEQEVENVIIENPDTDFVDIKTDLDSL